MIRFLPWAILLSTLLTSASAIDIDSLLIRSVGGTSALESIATMTGYRAEGSVTLNGQPGRFIEYFTSPDHYYLRLDLTGFSLIQAYDGRIAWQIDHNNQVSLLEGYEKDELLKGVFFGSFSYLIPDRLEGNYEYLGKIVQDGKAYYQVAFYPLNKDTVLTYYDTETSLQAFTESKLDELITHTHCRDYRRTGGILWPYSSEMSARNAPFSIGFHYDQILVNAEIDQSIFDVPESSPKDYHFPINSDSIVIPIDYHAGHIRIRATINGKYKCWLILDSGSSANIFDKSFANDIGLEEIGSLSAKGLSTYEEVQMVRTDSVTIEGLTLYDQVAGAMNLMSLSDPESDGRPFGGILGYDFLSRFPMLVNYRNSTLTVYNPDMFTPPVGGSEVSFFLTMKVPTVHGELNGIQGNFIIDLGNVFGLIIHSKFAHDNHLTETLDDVRPNPVSIGGISGTIPGKTAYAASFKIGDILFQSLRVILPDSAQGLAGSEELAGNIGNLLLDNFNVLFDYNNSRLIFFDADNK